MTSLLAINTGFYIAMLFCQVNKCTYQSKLEFYKCAADQYSDRTWYWTECQSHENYTRMWWMTKKKILLSMIKWAPTIFKQLYCFRCDWGYFKIKATHCKCSSNSSSFTTLPSQGWQETLLTTFHPVLWKLLKQNQLFKHVCSYWSTNPDTDTFNL